VKKYTKETCPKSSTWFNNGGRCGWAHVCDECENSPKNRNHVKKVEEDSKL